MINHSNTPPSVDKQFLMEVWGRASVLGIDLHQICQKQQLINPLTVHGERVPLALVSALYDAVETELKSPEYIYALIANPKASHALLQLALCCATVGEAMRLICRYSAVASDACRFRLSESGWQYSFIAEEHRGVYVSPLQIEAIFHTALRQLHLWMNTTTLPNMVIYFRHAPRFDPQRYTHYFGCEVKFQQTVNKLVFDADIYQFPLANADQTRAAYFANTLKRYESVVLAQGELPKRIQQLLIQRLAFGEPDQIEIARCLNMSTRNLHRRLQELNTTFRQLVEDTRFVVAQQELSQSQHAMQEVALMLGYSDKRTFHRAFRRWAGMTPAQWRSLHQASSP